MNKWTFIILIVLAIGASAAVGDDGCTKACGSGKCVAKGGYESCDCGIPYHGENCQKGGFTIAAYVFGGICAVSLVTTMILQIVNCIRNPKEEDVEEVEMETKTEGKSLPEGKNEKQVYNDNQVQENVYEKIGGGGRSAEKTAEAAEHPVPSAPAQSEVVIEDDCYIDLQNGQEPVYEKVVQ